MRSDVLVSTAWAQDHLDDDSIVFVEVDEISSSYHTEGHLRGAVALDWKNDLQQTLRRDVVGREEFGRLMGSRGISREHTVVLYGGNHNWFAAYAFWYLRLYGHRDIRLMDGGKMRWQMDGRELTTAVPERAPTTYTADEPDASIRARRDDVIAGLDTDEFIDVRSVDEYTGLLLTPPHLPQEGGHQRGHIPGAVNIPWNRAVGRDGTIRSDEELRAIYADILEEGRSGEGRSGEGRSGDGRRIVTYCRIGERSSHTWFVLHELLGVENVVNYDGSWVEYGSLIDVPVER